MNPGFTNTNATLAAIWETPSARLQMWELLQQSGYRTARNAFLMRETGGWFSYDGNTGNVAFHAVAPQRWNGIDLGQPPSVPAGTSLAHVHTHPSYGRPPPGGGQGQTRTPNGGDIDAARHYGLPGFMVNSNHEVWSFDERGYR